jgi:hypothetical protein
MLLKLNEKIKDIYGRDIKKLNSEELYLLKDVIIFSLMKTEFYKDDMQRDINLYTLAEIIRDSNEKEMNKEEMEIILECVYKSVPTEIFGYVCKLLKLWEGKQE